MVSPKSTAPEIRLKVPDCAASTAALGLRTSVPKTAKATARPKLSCFVNSSCWSGGTWERSYSPSGKPSLAMFHAVPQVSLSTQPRKPDWVATLYPTAAAANGRSIQSSCHASTAPSTSLLNVRTGVLYFSGIAPTVASRGLPSPTAEARTPLIKLSWVIPTMVPATPSYSSSVNGERTVSQTSSPISVPKLVKPLAIFPIRPKMLISALRYA